MQQPKVSIVVPCWGVEKYLDKCVESIVNQTLRDIEIILVDDVSPDRVPEMCDAWAQKDSRIKVIHKSKNEGLGMACNTGIDAATGEYIAFCDSDDWVDTDMYETMYKYAREENFDAIYTGLKRVNSQGKSIGHLTHPDTEMRYYAENIKELGCEMVASAPSTSKERIIQCSAKVVLYKLSLINDHRIRFVSERRIPSEDLIFNLDFLSHCTSACVLPLFKYNYRVTEGSITAKIDLQRFKKLVTLYEYLDKNQKSWNVCEDFNSRNTRLLLGYTRVFICAILQSSCTRKEKKRIVKQINYSKTLSRIWKEYPVRSMPLFHKMFFIAMHYNLYYVLYILAKIKNLK